MTWRGEGVSRACWAPEQADRILRVEAETPEDAVFLATHTALPIRVLDDPVSDAGQRVTEEDLLAVALRSSDKPIVPILGPSGSGKSHLVRWLRHRLEVEDPADVQVVFIPKRSMSLRRIAETILASGGDAPEIEQLRGDLARSAADVEPGLAVLSLRSALANLVQVDGATSGGQEVGPDEIELRTFLASGLPSVLNDPHISTYLLAPGSAIDRLAREKLEGRGEEDKEQEFAFEASDLLLSVDDVAQAAKQAQQTLGQLSAQADLRVLAARMLNEQLDRAIEQVFGVSGETMSDIFLRLRRLFHRNNQRLLLLIEDFSMFQGVQGGMIDAMTVIPRVGEELCELRTVMAVTTGYFREALPDTVRTRVDRAFDLASSTENPVDVPKFTAAYLNAIRLGVDALTDGGDEGVGSACSTCAAKEDCHGSFDAVDDVGLFPFTRSLVEDLARGLPTGFVARGFLTNVLRPVLSEDHGAVAGGTFPTLEFEHRFSQVRAGRVPADEQTRLRRADDPANDERRVRTVRYFGGTSGTTVVVPRSGVFAAFDLRPPDLGLGGGGDEPPVPPVPPLPQPPTGQPREDSELAKALDKWLNTSDLIGAHRNATLDLIVDALRPRLRLDDGAGGTSVWSSRPALTRESVALEGTPAAGEPGKLVIPRDAETVAALQDIERFRAAGAWEALPEGGRRRQRAESFLRRWTTAFETDVLRRRSLKDELPAVVSTLRASAWALGTPGAFGDDEEVLGCLVAPPRREAGDLTSIGRRILEGASPKDRLEGVHIQLLRTVGFSQGSAEPRLIDATEVLRALAIAPLAPSPEGLVPPVNGMAALVAAMLQPALLTEQLDALRATVPDTSLVGDDLDALRASLRRATEALAHVGALPAVVASMGNLADRHPDLTELLARVRATQRSIDEADPSDPRSALRALADGSATSTTDVRRWLTDVARALDAMEAAVTTAAGGDVIVAYQGARQRLRDAADLLDGGTAVPAPHDSEDLR